MKITFCVNTTGLTGGIRVVFIYANKLIENGHKVTILYPYNLSGRWFSKDGFIAFLKWLKYSFLKIFDKTGADWFPLKAKIFRVPSLRAKWLPEADVVIATANETADWVAKLPLEKGEKFYYIQDYEIWTRDSQKVKKTYKLPLKKIVISPWLQKLMIKKFQDKNCQIITNGVDLEIFYNKKKKFNKNKKILMMYHILAKKGIKDGLKAYRLVKEKHPEVKLILFSAYPKGDDVPKEAEFYRNPSQAILRKLYSSADIFLSPSWQEGWQLPPMEAAACKTAVVATNVGGVPYYTISKKTALVVPAKKPKLLAKAILELVEDQSKLKKISFAGYKFIKKFSWKNSVIKFEKILKDALNPDLSKLKKIPKVGILVLNWNQKKMTSFCLSKLLKIDYPNFQIYLVDNGSTDGSSEFLKQKFGQKIQIIQNKKNEGYAKGNNLGLKQILKQNPDYILVLNNDVKVKKNFLNELIKTSIKYPQAGMIVPKVFYAGKKKIFQAAGGNFVKHFGEARLRGHLEKNLDKFKFPKEVDFAPGVCILLPKKTLEKIGKIPTEYFMFGEDVDWSFRAKKSGFKIIYSPKSEIEHFESLTAGVNNPVKTYYYLRNILILMKKWFPAWYFWLVFLLFFHYKIIKMKSRYFIEGNYPHIWAIVRAWFAFWLGERGESKKYSFIKR